MSLKMKKFASLKGVLDNLRHTHSPPPSPVASAEQALLENDLLETLSDEQFTCEMTMRHGFPNKAVCAAFDPLQRIMAIGNRLGEVCVFGRPGVDLRFKHDSGEAVFQMEFVINKGQILTACVDDTVNLWEFGGKGVAELAHSIKLNKERLTVMSLEIQDKWLYLGTERGNVLVLDMDTFTLSGYLISWNKCMDPMQKNHPGAIVHISTNPADPSKLLIGFRSGLICLWDLPTKKGEQRYTHSKVLTSVCWHMEGRQFVAAYEDGSLVTWNLKPQAGASSVNKPQSVQFPHGKKNKETNKFGPCDPIGKVIWRVNKNGENYFVFSGGLPEDVTGVTPSITIMQGKATTLLEMENCVIDFMLVTDSPYSSNYQDPEAVLVMLTNDLVAIDCKSPGYLCFRNPYAMDFNESPVTCCYYLVDSPGDLIPALYLVGSRAQKEGKSFSSKDWPVNGGVDSESCPYTELVITGHSDGSLKFWDGSSTAMQSLYRLKTAKYFEKAKRPPSGESLEDNPYAITKISLCGNQLAVSGAAGQVIFFRFRKKETETETKAMEIPIVYEVLTHPVNTEPNSQQENIQVSTPNPSVASQCASSTDPVDAFNFDRPQYEYFSSLRLRQGSQRKNPGYHAELVCTTPWVNNEPPTPISSLTVNSSFGLLAYGNGSGLVIVDIVQFVCLLNMGTADLYGSVDPFQRMPRSPKPLDSSFINKVELGSYSQVEKNSISSNLASKAEETNLSASKSRSSSSSSLDGIVTHEGVVALCFADSFPTKNEFTLCPCLYVGTSLGSLIPIVINVPDKESRKTESVIVSPSGSLFRIRGAILTMTLLDSSLKEESAVNVKVTNKTHSHNSQDAASPSGDQQIVVVCTEKCASVHSLPSQRQMYSQTINESAKVVTAQIINFGGEKYTPCLVAYTSDGFVKAYSLPSLRPLLDFYFMAKVPRVQQTLTFSDYGHGLFLCNQNEVQKFTISVDYMRQLQSMQGLVFQDSIPMPEPPKPSFLKGLFGGGPKPLDREELFGETAGKVSAKVATQLKGGGAAGMTGLQGKGAGATSEVSKAKMAFVERGQKVSELEDRTEQLAVDAKLYADNARNLLNKEKNRKWYQL